MNAPMIIRDESDDSLVCGLCWQPLVRLALHVKTHGIEVFSCSTCGWHTRSVDGQLVARDSLFDLDAPDAGTATGDAVTWYRLESVYNGRAM
jgi:hypothetical protein